MKKCISLVFIMLLLAVPAVAKRRPPAFVRPVIIGHVRYSAPHFVDGKKQRGGYIRATHLRTRRVMGGRYIYRIRLNPYLEGDVQDVFITSLKRHPRKKMLIIRNSRGHVYHLDVETWRVCHQLKMKNPSH